MQVVCTGTLAVGSRRLAEHNVVVSRLGAIEELAGMTVLCSDKTGEYFGMFFYDLNGPNCLRPTHGDVLSWGLGFPS